MDTKSGDGIPEGGDGFSPKEDDGVTEDQIQGDGNAGGHGGHGVLEVLATARSIALNQFEGDPTSECAPSEAEK